MASLATEDDDVIVAKNRSNIDAKNRSNIDDILRVKPNGGIKIILRGSSNESSNDLRGFDLNLQPPAPADGLSYVGRHLVFLPPKVDVSNTKENTLDVSTTIDVFYIYTTAIGYPGMIEGWKFLLGSILDSIPGTCRIEIAHYTPPEKDYHNHNIENLSHDIDTEICGDRLKGSSCYLSPFPKSGIDSTKPHILIDMAHLVTYATAGRGGLYYGYDKDYIGKFNYIYLGYKTFVSDSLLLIIWK